MASVSSALFLYLLASLCRFGVNVPHAHTKYMNVNCILSVEEWRPIDWFVVTCDFILFDVCIHLLYLKNQQISYHTKFPILMILEIVA